MQSLRPTRLAAYEMKTASQECPVAPLPNGGRSVAVGQQSQQQHLVSVFFRKMALTSIQD